MASLRREATIAASPDHVWDAVRDFGNVHTRLARGFATGVRMDGNARIVTFTNGTSAREVLVDCDDAGRRLVYAIASERVTHYNASVQIMDDAAGRSKFVWIVDVLPDDIAPYISAQMDLGIAAIKRTLEE